MKSDSLTTLEYGGMLVKTQFSRNRPISKRRLGLDLIAMEEGRDINRMSRAGNDDVRIEIDELSSTHPPSELFDILQETRV